MKKGKAAFYQGEGIFHLSDHTIENIGNHEVLVEVAYCGICGTDLHIYRGHMDSRVGQKRIIGHECSGTIVELGKDVRNFTVGDRVTVRPLNSCGQCPACLKGFSHICHNLRFMGIDSDGALQQYWTVPGQLLHKLPRSLSLKTAALAEPLAVAAHDVRIGEVKEGELVVVLGGGPIGLLVAMLAGLKGARVILCEINRFRIELAQELGLEVLNPEQEDIEKYVNNISNSAGADIVFEVTGTKEGAEMMTKLPGARGRIVVVAIYSFKPEVDLFRLFWREIQIRGTRVYESEDFEESISLLEHSGAVFDKLVSNIERLENIQQVFQSIDNDPESMKTLIDCQISAPANE